MVQSTSRLEYPPWFAWVLRVTLFIGLHFFCLQCKNTSIPKLVFQRPGDGRILCQEVNASPGFLVWCKCHCSDADNVNQLTFTRLCLRLVFRNLASCTSGPSFCFFERLGNLVLAKPWIRSLVKKLQSLSTASLASGLVVMTTWLICVLTNWYMHRMVAAFSLLSTRLSKSHVAWPSSTALVIQP